ncbi:hypothetical protein AMS68_000090 [Peltaster fructicola]|uniref:tRNA (guanine(26)-N(2))-dimethyltransferase n=1 Tax=Peltaster fructicola TaxID=286661 RepID=A0A6H0XIL8_9PEZI|nr:hypothetical protein AMS68_000090 [Peltaster fructicola]
MRVAQGSPLLRLTSAVPKLGAASSWTPGFQAPAHPSAKYAAMSEAAVPLKATPKEGSEDKLEVNDTAAPKAQNVFYNPIQQFNRDLSVLAIKAFGEDLCERRRADWEKSQERFAAKRERRKDNKRKRHEDVQAGEAVKIQRLDGEDAPGADDNDPQLEGSEDHTTTDKSPPATIENDSAVPSEPNGNHTMQQEDRQDGQPDKNGDGEHSKNHKPQSPPFRILDALSATGLRALRYAQEIPFATSIVANDMDRGAVKSIEMHIQHNQLADKIQPSTANALAHMYGVAYPSAASHGPAHVSKKYDVIDLDPYGTAAPFIDASLQALNDGGLLCVTCTDSALFASCGYSEKTFALYGGLPVKGNHCHEAGLRLIAHSIAMTGAKYGLAIEPLLSLSIDFYARLFIRVRRSAADVKFLAGKTMIVYECDHGCGTWTTQLLGRNVAQPTKGESVIYKHSMSQAPTSDKLCEHCGSKMHIAGPMWAGPLHHPGFIEQILKDVRSADKNVYGTTTRLEGMLDTALDELLNTEYIKESKAPNSTIPKIAPASLDPQPFYFTPSAAARAVQCQAPPEAAVKGALRHAGYRATRSHCKGGSVKTNAPWSAVWNIMREWVKQKSPVKVENIRRGSPAWHILRLGDHEEPAGTTKAELNETEKPAILFDEALGRDQTGKKLVRYQANPRENWGPMSRAKGAH